MGYQIGIKANCQLLFRRCFLFSAPAAVCLDYLGVCFAHGSSIGEPLLVEFHGVRVGSDSSTNRSLLALLSRDFLECHGAPFIFGSWHIL